MKRPTIEVSGRDRDSLARSTRASINGSSICTPEVAPDISARNLLASDVLRQGEFKLRNPPVEVYRSISVDKLNACVGEKGESTEGSRALANELGSALRRALEAGGIPMLVLSLTDNNRNPLNALPPKRELDFVMDLLWRPENKVVVLPILGTLTRPSQYSTLIDAVTTREETIQERYIMPVIPSTYRSITEEIVERFWKAGARLFAADLQGRGFSANAPSISLIQRSLGRQSRRDRSTYLLHALNARERVGVQNNARSNWLMGSAFGFDTVGGNHIPPKGSSPVVDPSAEVERISFLQARDYGFYPIGELAKRQTSRREVELDTLPFSAYSLSELTRSKNPKLVRSVAKQHNLTKALRETKRLQSQLDGGDFGSYLRRKERVAMDYDLAREVVSQLRVRTID